METSISRIKSKYQIGQKVRGEVFGRECVGAIVEIRLETITTIRETATFSRSSVFYILDNLEQMTEQGVLEVLDKAE